MRSAVGNHIRKRVAQFMKKHLPAFTEDKAVELPRGSRLYVWKASENLWWYVFLMFQDDRDWFRLRLMWTTKRKFETQFGGLPWPPQENVGVAFGHLGFPAGSKLAAFDGGHELSSPGIPSEDHSDLSWLDPVPVDQAIAAADVALNADFNTMLKFGIPYTEEVRKLAASTESVGD